MPRTTIDIDASVLRLLKKRQERLPALAAGLLLVLPLLLAQPAAAVVSPALGTESTFAVLGGSAVTNTGASVVTGDLGVSRGSSISGFPPGQVVGGIIQSAPVSTAAQADIGTAMGEASGQPCNTNLSLHGRSSGTTTIDYLKVGATVVIAVPTTIAPNTGVTVGGVTLVP